MSVVIALILVAVLGVLLGTGLALVRSRKQRDATLLEPPPGALGVPDAVKDDVARHKAELDAQIAAEEATAETGIVVDEALAAAVEDALSAPTVEAPEAPVKPRFRDRLGKARTLLGGYVGSILSREKIDPQTWDELEEALIRADVGIEPTTELLDQLRAQVKEQGVTDSAELLELLKADLKQRLSGFDLELHLADTAPSVWLFVGVNGVGKTTTIGKVGAQQTAGGRSVLMAAGDTFRAAAVEQLGTWAERSGAELVRGNEGGDPSAVIFDAIERATARQIDLVLGDTAGRLHTKTNLMEELRKVRRVAAKGAGRVTEVLLVIDATTGQNGLAQAREFGDATMTDGVGLTGVVLTKLDGSAKGGIVFAIETELGLPVKLVGLGETITDMVPFDPAEFIDALIRED